MDGKTVCHNMSSNIFAHIHLNFCIHITSLDIRPNQSILRNAQIYLRCLCVLGDQSAEEISGDSADKAGRRTKSRDANGNVQA